MKTEIATVSEGEICKALNSYFIGNCRYKLANAFIFKNDWESDFFVQKDNGYAYEFEIKISRSDFFSDKKKIEKHSILEYGGYYKKYSQWSDEKRQCVWHKNTEITIHEMRPNKFFYVVPTGLITVNELPKYAGLFYYGEGRDYSCGLKKIKDAPFLHKEALEFEKILCKKFYNYWLNSKFKIHQLEHELENVKSDINGI